MATHDQHPVPELHLAGVPLGRTDDPRTDSSALPGRALYCPECGMPTWVEWRDGDHVKIRCFSRHWFLMLADRLP